MNKLDVQPASLMLSPAARSELGPARWLIVLVPGVQADLTAATRRVWELANAGSGRVRFIGLYENAVQELSLRRQLVTMSAMVRDTRTSVETEVVFGKDWVEVLKSRWYPGDMVVCFAEQRAGPLHRPLSQILQSDLGMPLYVLSGLYSQDERRSNWPAQALAWGGSIAIILGFFLLQVRIDHLAKDWTHIVLPLLSIPVEVLMIWGWNSLIG